MRNQLITIILTLLSGASLAHATDLSTSVNSLGGNQELVRRAKAIDPKNRVQVVQNRTVDRTWRLELGLNYGMVAGGDSYMKTNNLGGSLDLHVNPKFSIGARYYNSSNTLNGEGERVFTAAQNARSTGLYQERPSLDYAMDTYLGVVNWYPMYGKLNLFDLGIAQFDIYLLAGGGQVKLFSGDTGTYTFGGGVGFWMSQHFSTRFEARYQTYDDQSWAGSRKLDLTVLSASLGWLL